jgi:Cu/Ag efflux protein CusF
MAMNIAKIILAGAAALTIVCPAALAQQALTGMVTKLDRIHGVVAIQRTQTGTVGTNAAGAIEEFKVQGGVSLDNLHAGDMITFATTDAGGVKTITKFEKQ